MSLIKRNVVSNDLSDYSIALLGEAGIGKTTMMVEACEKEFGPDGYVIFNMGAEQGIDCLDGAAYIDIPDWKTLDAVIKEMIKNRNTEYKDIKVIVYDTLDQLFEFGEKRVIELHNREHMGEKNFKPCTSINSAYGGFGKGLDKNIEIIMDTIKMLQKAGYRVWYTAHVKTKEIVDAVSGETYNQLTASMSQKYFNSIKDKMHCVGMAVIDRTIEKEGTGRKNIATRQEIEISKVKEEKRKIVFRDDSYSIESKSRFANIANEVPMDVDAFLAALHDAINAAGGKTKSKPTPPSKPIPESIPEDPNPNFEADLEEPDVDEFVDEGGPAPENLRDQVQTLFKECTDAVVKKEVRDVIKEYGKLSDVPDVVLFELYDKLQ